MLGILGKREVIGILGLALAAGVAYTGLQNAQNEVTPPRRPAQLGQRVGAPAPAPVTWRVEFFSEKIQGSKVSNGSTFVEKLDISVERAPFIDFEDGKWSVVVEGPLQIARGFYTFTIEYRGDVRVFVSGNEVAKGSSGQRVVPLQVNFDAPLEGTGIRIEGIDTQGPFVLRWR
jgi:hypothetical protein